MTIDEKIKTLRALNAESESKLVQTLGIERGLLGEVEEELRTLRAQVAVQKIEYFTEAEFADRLKCTRDHLSRLRRKLGDALQPPPYIGWAVRWSTKHLLQANELLGAMDTGKKKPGRKRAGVRSRGSADLSMVAQDKAA
jgi:hypothetical protein